MAVIALPQRRLTLPPVAPGSWTQRPISVAPAIDEMLARNAVVAVGVSGGKDSVAVALAVARHLDQIGHTGPRVLVHADLGRVEWKDSLPACERLAAKLGWELITCARNAGDMLARWQGRWAANVRRYTNLECVKVILPWSTPSMRFCTSELKVQVISSTLRKRFPGQDIVNVAGIRRQESSTRAKMPVAAAMSSLTRKNAKGMSWNAIIDYKVEDVLQEIADGGLELHEAYTKYGLSRVSCCWCIMSSAEDMLAAAQCEDNHPLYRQMVELEIESTFAFQGSRWLADVAPELLTEDTRARVQQAKARAERRVAIEAELPKSLYYVKGWPIAMPTLEEAELLARVRRQMGELLGIEMRFTTAAEVLARYAEKLQEKAAKGTAAVDESDEESEDEDAQSAFDFAEAA